jgi:cell division protein ZapA (FtsZ GTPase activity inhibitor)
MGDSFQITIMGQTYLLKGSHDKDYVARVENFLNEQIGKARASGAIADSYNLMVLVALNLADDCMKKDDEIKKLMGSIESDTQRLINLIDSRL